MELTETLFAIEKTLSGSDSFLIESPHRLRINAGNGEILNEKVPDNKKWRVVVNIVISEADQSADI